MTATANKPRRVILYGRNSYARNGREISVDDQFNEMRGAAAREGWVIVDEFRDVGRSATRHARKRRDDYEAMRAAILAGKADILMTWESSRAQRDLTTYVALRNLCHETKTMWWYNHTLYDLSLREDRYRTGMDALRDEDEGELIRERVLRTVRGRAERGLPHGRTTYGYTRQYDPKTRAFIAQVPDPDTAPIVKEVITRVAAGHSTYGIAKDLNMRGVPTPRHGKRGWTLAGVRQICLNAAYIGKRVHNGETVGDAVWEGLVDPVTFWKATAILSAPERRSTRNRAVVHLLSGIAVCGVCQQPLRVRHPRNAYTYTCVQSFCVAIAEHLLDDYVEAALLERMEKPDAAEIWVSESSDERVAAALAEETQAQAELAQARALAEKGELSALSLAAIEKGTLPRIEAARLRARALVLPPVVGRLAGPHARRVWGEEFTIEEQREALRALVTVTVNRTYRGARSIKPGRIGLDWSRPALRG